MEDKYDMSSNSTDEYVVANKSFTPTMQFVSEDRLLHDCPESFEFRSAIRRHLISCPVTNFRVHV